MSTVDTQHKDYAKMVNKWKRCRDTVSGQDAVHDAGETYLPKLKDQTADAYEAYKLRTQFFNAVWRTISSLSGMIFRKPPVINVASSIEELLNDVTMSGVNFQIFAQQTAIEILTSGRMGILVDYPAQSVEGMTAADAAKLNLRPTMQKYNAETIINWKVGRIGNRSVLTQVVLTEDFSEAENEFVEKTETRYRVLDLFENKYRVRVFRIDENKEDELVSEVIPLMSGNPLDYIPFYFIGIDDTTPAVDDPPLIDIVDVNLDHYRLDADYKHGLHFTGLPTLFISGYTPENKGDKLYIGSPVCNALPDPAAKAYFVEFTGQGLQAIKEAKEADEQQMAILGARLLTSEKKDTETAQTAQIHRAGESSILSAIAQTISIGLTNALNTFSAWAGSPGKWSVTLNQEFLPPEMTPQELAGILQAWQAGMPGFSDQGVFDLLQKREVIAPDVTLEDELSNIDNKQIPKPDMTV
jgi:hypothetical protein